MKFVVTLVVLETNETLSGTYENDSSYEAVASAFACLVGKPKSDCLDTVKVLAVTEIKDDCNS